MTEFVLGQQSAYPTHYDPNLLFPIARAKNRASLGVNNISSPPFFGVDLWNAYELAWLNLKGKPQIALAEFIIPADSPNMIESKSFKLYLNSLNQHCFANFTAVKTCLQHDLSQVLGTGLQVRLIQPCEITSNKKMAPIEELDGQLLDRLDIEVNSHQNADPLLLKADHTSAPITQTLVSHLLKSNCPVTGQPDWASVQIQYQGRPIDEEGLLRYLIGFRQLGEFHEHCVEKIFCDIKIQCQPEKLSVYARYTRRGGLDINPFRTDFNAAWPNNIRHARQ
ncbi:MAG: NADPH-dependent 7-cyano-7-deazaguanine reductase QueF [Burkholderiaceae bacterium]|jgi:7-cyano-7-deazaguanine reductase|nr:NADPH-dependent 7-cyano-7-deazaguanine reductase QueF [Burkholderiaceae bacterium]